MKNKYVKIVSLILVLIIILSLFSSCKEKISIPKYTLDISFDDKEYSITCVEKVEYINNTDEVLDKICFNTFGNAYREQAKYRPISEERVYSAYPKGKNYGNIDIKKVSINKVDAKFVLGGVDCNFLTINLTEPLNCGERVVVEIEFTEKLALVRHRLGYTEKAVTLGNFFPILAVFENGSFVECPYYNKGDPFYSEVANFIVSIKYPSSYVISSSGQNVSFEKGEDFSTLLTKASNMRDFAITLSKDYKVITEKVGKCEVSYYYYLDDSPETSFLAAKEALITFNKLFGDYPYPTLSISQTNFIHGGMEYPALVYISDNLTKEQQIEVIAHEISHQWW